MAIFKRSKRKEIVICTNILPFDYLNMVTLSYKFSNQTFISLIFWRWRTNTLWDLSTFTQNLLHIITVFLNYFLNVFQIVWSRAGLRRAIAWRGHKKQFGMESKIFCHLTFAWKTRGESSGSRVKIFDECHRKSTWQWKLLELHLRVIFFCDYDTQLGTLNYFFQEKDCIKKWVYTLVTQPMKQSWPNQTDLRSVDSYIRILCRFQKRKQKLTPLSRIHRS